MQNTNDGFLIADEDLKMRGPGAFFTSKQSGFLKYSIADLVRDKNIIKNARQAAFEMIKMDPHLINIHHKFVRDKFILEYKPLLREIKLN